MTILLLLVTLAGLVYTATRLTRGRRGPAAWEGGLLWLMSFLVMVVLLVRG